MIERLVLMSLSGTVVFLLFQLLCGMVGDRLSARWQYTAMKLVLLFLLLPVGPCLQGLCGMWQAAEVPAAAPSTAGFSGMELPTAVTEMGPTQLLDSPQLVISPTANQISLAIWGICAVGILLLKGVQFLKFKHWLRQGGLEEAPADMLHVLWDCQKEIGSYRPVRLWVSSAAPTPFAAGLLHPVIVLPRETFSKQELQYILLHELTHIKCGDLWVRWFAMLARAIHWWNPLVYLWNRKLIVYSEESCDEQVVLNWPSQERGDYGRVLLKTACASTMPEGLTASISTTKLLQRRLWKMLHAKAFTRKQKAFAVAAISALLICGSAAAFAIQSPVAVGEEENQVYEADRTAGAATSQKLPTDGDNSGNAIISAPKGETVEPEKSTGPAAGEEQEESGKEQAVPAVRPEDVADQKESEKNADGEKQVQTIPEEYRNALRGDAELILARGGTLLPDDDPEAYCRMNGVFYKQFAAKGSTEDTLYMMTEYEVGNWDLLNPSKQKIASETLIDGEYPKNSSGESYGATTLAGYVGYSPDLVSARGTRGESGYIREAEIETLPNLPEQECPHEFAIPLYDSEGTVIGEFSVSCGGHHDKTMTLEEARAAALEGSE